MSVVYRAAPGGEAGNSGTGKLGGGLCGIAFCGRAGGASIDGAWGVITAGWGTAGEGVTIAVRFAPKPSAINESELSFPVGCRF